MKYNWSMSIYGHICLLRFSSRSGSDTLMRQFHLVKNCILSSTNRRMHSCPGLHQSGWTTIGILIVDAAVRQSIWREHPNAAQHNHAFSTSSSSSSGGKKSEPSQEVAGIDSGSVDNRDVEVAAVKDLWDQKVDITIQQALGNAAHMLRAGDIVSLKTFFR